MTFSPTPEQQAIIDYVTQHPTSSLMVDARAGAAKTSTILMAAQAMDAIQGGILALAFNVRIKKELEERLPPTVTCLTLNSLGHRAWGTRLNRKLQVDSDKLYTLAKEVIPKEAAASNEDLIQDTLALVRAAKSNGLVPTGAPGRPVPGLVPDGRDVWEGFAFDKGFTLYDEAYIYAKQILLRSINTAFKGVIDFDDQIYMSVLFGGVYPRYHTVIVDEAQDLSPLNHRQLVKAFSHRLIAVGDPYQAIYAFRGADSNSMTNMLETCNVSFEKLGLTYSFRCPSIVAARQHGWVTDFKAWKSNPEGTVERWGTESTPTWNFDSIPEKGAIICRNNAPLMKLAFALIRNRRPVKILGRDIGANLAALLLRICGRNNKLEIEAALDLLEQWKKLELAKAGDSQSKQAAVEDRYECLLVLLEASGSKTVGEAASFIKDLFDERGADLVLTSGHRSKGLEWDWVMHLDPWRVPSKQALKSSDLGNPGPLIQEKNLLYVIETRTKHTLVLANLDDCENLQ